MLARQDRQRKFAALGAQRLHLVVDAHLGDLRFLRQPHGVLRPPRTPIAEYQRDSTRAIALGCRDVDRVKRQRRTTARFGSRDLHRQLLSRTRVEFGYPRSLVRTIRFAFRYADERDIPDAADTDAPDLDPG